MKATAPSGGGGGDGAETVKPKRRKKAGGGGFIFGCGGSKSVAVVAGNLSTMALAKASSSSTAATAKPAPKGKQPAPSCHRHDADGPQSVDALLGHLRELERGVRALGVRVREEDGAQAQACRCSARPRHRRDAWGGGSGRLEESVAVVTETEDPLGEFRRSMAEMVVENGITGGAELRELLQRFLSLNSVRHHHLILRAFADVWEELFAGPGDPTQKHNHKHKQKRPVVSPAGHSARASS